MRVIKVKFISGYQLELTFDNKEMRIVDLSEKLKHAEGIFKPLKDVEYFKKVALDDCALSICWPNGADICPDVLYDMGTPSSNRLKQRHAKAKPVPKRTSKRAKVIKTR